MLDDFYSELLASGSELRRVWTAEAVIDAIKHRRAAGLNVCTVPTQQEDKGLYGAAVSRFGNWNNALQAAGIDARIRERWSKEKVFERLRHHAKHSPGQNIRKIDSHLAHAATRRFGSLSNAMEAAGVAPKRKTSRSAT